MKVKIWKTPKGTELPLLDMRGKDYLQVAHRLVWFREECPKYSIETEFVEITASSAFAKATIKDDTGRVISTGHKFEDKLGFGDFREKAETGAIGRALALVGFGTQFCADDLDEGARIVDAPQGRVVADQPGPEDGAPQRSPAAYVVPFGKYARYGLDEIDHRDLRSYVNYLESKALKDGKPLTGQFLDFVKRATSHIAAFENGSAVDFGSDPV